MAGKSNKSKNRGKGANSNPNKPPELQQKPTDSLTLSNDGSEAARTSNGDAIGVEDETSRSAGVDGNLPDQAQRTEVAATPSKHAEGGKFFFLPLHFISFYYLQMS